MEIRHLANRASRDTVVEEYPDSEEEARQQEEDRRINTFEKPEAARLGMGWRYWDSFAKGTDNGRPPRNSVGSNIPIIIITLNSVLLIMKRYMHDQNL